MLLLTHLQEVLKMLLLAMLMDLQLQLLRLTESSEITRSIRHRHGRRGCRKLLLPLAGDRRSHNTLSFLLFVAIVLQEHRVLPGLSANLIQLLLKALLLRCDAIQFARIRVVQFLIVLS